METRCKACNSQLNVKQGQYKSEEGSTDVFLEQTFSCSNKECTKFDEIVETVYSKLN